LAQTISSLLHSRRRPENSIPNADAVYPEPFRQREKWGIDVHALVPDDPHLLLGQLDISKTICKEEAIWIFLIGSVKKQGYATYRKFKVNKFKN
jgi:hypothetical protein